MSSVRRSSPSIPPPSSSPPDPKCFDCGCAAPDLDQEQTLRSTLGWRLVFDRQPDGSNKPIWRCPDCWQKYKNAKQA
jgi:hypothetical protein